MAISSNRVSLSSIVDVAKSTYNKASDTAAIKSARSLADLKPSTMKKSILSAAEEKVTSALGSKVLGLTETDCTTVGDMLNKPLGAGKDRELNRGIDSDDCINITVGLNPTTGLELIDTASSKILSQVPALSKKVLKISPKHEDVLDKLINNNVKQSLKSLGIPNSKQSCLLNNSKGNLINGMSGIGFSNMAKLKIGDLLRNGLDCLNDVLGVIDGGMNFAGVSLVGTINALSKVDVSKTVEFASKIGSDVDAREQFFSGHKLAINGKDDTSIENKLLLLSAVKKTAADDNQSNKEAIMTLGSTTAVLTAVGDSDKVTNSPVSDYGYVTSSLTSMDPNWNKDIDGEINYSGLNGNKRLATLANSKAQSTQSTSTDFTTGTVTKNIEDDQAMHIMLAQAPSKNPFEGDGSDPFASSANNPFEGDGSDPFGGDDYNPFGGGIDYAGF